MIDRLRIFAILVKHSQNPPYSAFVLKGVPRKDSEISASLPSQRDSRRGRPLNRCPLVNADSPNCLSSSSYETMTPASEQTIMKLYEIAQVALTALETLFLTVIRGLRRILNLFA